ncbi:MAG: polyphosphate kinase 2 family protein [Gemmatimonadaceae bacterium]|nr:polyphosphate kinase 2 family protein [Gemmatimonadaceae bacterium]
MTKHLQNSDFRVRVGTDVDLATWPTCVKPLYKSKKADRKLLETQVHALSTLQRVHCASDRYAMLLIFQGMDSAGKDGAIRHVMSGVNPQGCQVFSFAQPSAVELDHDFIWRTTRALPERGRIGNFNRSYYEEVLIVRVHPQLLEAQQLLEELRCADSLWTDRYRSIVDFERHLHVNGTRVIKFFLHLSKDEQRKRLLARIDEPDKNWKLSLADVEEREFWSDYQTAYGKCLAATSTEDAPWYVVPADDKKNARLIISAIIVGVFNHLHLRYPTSTSGYRHELQMVREPLAT